jgi:hypothetical protein
MMTSVSATVSTATGRSSRLFPGVAPARVAAVAGIAYAVLVAVENLDVLGAPRYSSSVADIVEAYRAPGVKLAITTIAGGLALVAYLVAAVSLWSVVRPRPDGPADTWSVVALGAAVAGPLIGATALALHTALVLGVDDSLSADSISRLHDVRLAVHATGAIPIGVFAVVASLMGSRTRRMPNWLARPGLVVGAAAAIASTAAIARTDAARASLLCVLAAAMGWLLATAIWLLHRDGDLARSDTLWVSTARLMAGAVAVAAGLSGVALLAFPAATADFFSWRLGPPPLAALVGGCYVASALVYARAAVAPWSEIRVMVAGMVALTAPIFTSTLVHLEVFDFGRIQAWAWVVLFGGFLVAAAAVLVGAPRPAPAGDRRLRPPGRVAAVALALALAAISIALWVDPSEGAAVLPFTPTPLSGRVLGGWSFLLAVLAAHLSIVGDAATARLPALAMAAFPAGALAAAVRTVDDLTPAGPRALYIAGLLVWLGIGVALVRDVGRAVPRDRDPHLRS